MVKYKIKIKKSANKELQKIPTKNLRKIIKKIQLLANEPRPKDCEKLTEQERYRIRQGNYRVVFEVHDKEKLIVIFKIGDRKEIYRS